MLDMMSPIERRREAAQLHTDVVGLLAKAMKDLHMAYDAANPLFWLTSAQERVRTSEVVIERLRQFAEALRPNV